VAILSMLFTRQALYGIMVLAIVGVLSFTYWQGKQDERRRVEVEVLRQDQQHRREADEVRDSIGRLPDDAVFDGLREWTRPGP
jgi:hypothetical protein